MLFLTISMRLGSIQPFKMVNCNYFARRQISISTSRRAFVNIDHYNIYYEKVGTGPKALFFLPGIIDVICGWSLGFAEADFGPIIRAMDTNKYTLVCWDPPGYGLSRPPDRDFCRQFYSRDATLAAKLMKILNLEIYSVFGWSNGGVTGVHLAATNPLAVERLVVWGAHAYADKRALQFAQMMGNLDLWSEKMLKPMLDMYGMEYLKKLLHDWAKSVEDYLKNDGSALYIEDQKKVQCPTLVLHGELDPVLGVEHAEWLHKTIPNSQLYIVPNAKHNLHLRFRDNFLDLVTAFLDNPDLKRNQYLKI